MQVFDASSMIYAWDNYPVNQFPGLWKWIHRQIEDEKLVMSRVAFQEVVAKTPECGDWLRDNGLKILEITGVALQKAMEIKNLLGIVGDKYTVGVGENDLIIIAVAWEHRLELVSNERVQNTLPPDKKKYKIPAVCKLPQVSVSCISFIEYIKRSEEVFG